MHPTPKGVARAHKIVVDIKVKIAAGLFLQPPQLPRIQPFQPQVDELDRPTDAFAD
jgi:hypothetical protein